MHDPLPPDLERLGQLARYLERAHAVNATVRTFLELQLEAVYTRQAELRTPNPGYVLQHIPSPRPSPGDAEGRGVIHLETCPLLEDVAGEHAFPADERLARIALEDPAEASTACETCQPGAGAEARQAGAVRGLTRWSGVTT